MVAIFHDDYIYDLCMNRNESAERFLLAFDVPLCRYHKLLSHVYLLKNAHHLPACDLCTDPFSICL